MIDKQTVEKIRGLFADKDFTEKVLDLLGNDKSEEAQKTFAAKGVELSIKDVDTIKRDLFASADGGDDEEMDMSQLRSVAGGANRYGLVLDAPRGHEYWGIPDYSEKVRELLKKKWA